MLARWEKGRTFADRPISANVSPGYRPSFDHDRDLSCHPFAVCVVCGALLSGLRTKQLEAQSQTLTLRPTGYVTGATFVNPGNAYDNNDATFANAHLITSCRTDCTTLYSKTTTWTGVSGGYHPIRLEVHWYSSAYGYLSGGDATTIEAKLEYSLDGGSSCRLIRAPE
jgi:hypothetical protein